MFRARRPLIRMIATVLVLVLAAAGCGDDGEDVVSDDPGGDGDGVANGEGGEAADADPVLVVELTGAFTTPEASYQELPRIVVYADGRAVRPAPHTLEYPGPALPPLNVLELTDEALEAIEEAAVAAGLDTDDVDYGEPPVADAGYTVVTVEIDGETYVHSANALGLATEDGLDPGTEGLTEEQVAAREALQGFVDQATDPRALVGDEAVGDEQAFTADRFRLWVRPADEVDAGVQPDADTIEPTTVEWTIDDVELAESMCLAVEGDAAAELAALLADVDALTRFESGGEVWAVVARPVLPHEPICPEG